MDNRKTALITGASGGFGHEFARLFAADGYDLVLVAQNREKLESVAAEFADVKTTVIVKDLSRPDAAEEIYNELAATHTTVDFLVNNAGYGLEGEFLELRLEDQLNMISLNITTLTSLTYLFARDMAVRRYGRIANVSSIAGFLPTPYLGVYSATKAFVLSFTETLNIEIAHKGDLSATAICPGPAKTGFAKRAHTVRTTDAFEKYGYNPGQVAREGYQALMNKKPVIIPGTQFALLVGIATRIPGSWKRAILSAFAK